MKVTTNHPESVKGQPVILRDDGGLCHSYATGIRIARVVKLGMSRKELAAALGVSWRTVEAWEHGRSKTPNARALNALGAMLDDLQTRPSGRKGE